MYYKNYLKIMQKVVIEVTMEVISWCHSCVSCLYPRLGWKIHMQPDILCIFFNADKFSVVACMLWRQIYITVFKNYYRDNYNVKCVHFIYIHLFYKKATKMFDRDIYQHVQQGIMISCCTKLLSVWCWIRYLHLYDSW